MKRRTFLSGAAGVAITALAFPPGPRAEARAGRLAAALGAIPAELRAQLAEERGIVYSLGQQRVWLLEPGFRLVRTYLVSGRYGNPPPGRYHVFSKALRSFSVSNPAVQWNYMVRFYRTPRGNNIGFHQIPVRCSSSGTCVPIQSESQLGTPRSAGCVRQRASDAKFLYEWAPVGTLVVVIR